MSPGVIPYLAFLKDKHPRLSFILAGPWDLKNQRFEYLETVLRKATQAIELGHLSDEAARKLVTVPVQQKMSYTPEALEYILRLTGRHAFYTQLLCNELVWRLGEREKVTLEDVEAAAEAVVLNPPGMLPIFWADSTPSEQAVLAGLARISFDEEDFAAAGTVYRQIRKSDLKLPVSSVPGGSSHVKCPKCGQEISTSGPAPPATAVEGSAQEMASATLAVHEVATILDDLVRRNILKVRSIFWYNFNVDLLRMWMREGYRL
jgi:hypothetical protein